MSTSSYRAIRRIHNAIELLPRPAVKRNHIRVRKGLGQVYRSPPKKRSQAHHAAAVICPLKAARRKTLEEKFRRLKENISATEDNDVLPSPADVFNDNPMDLDENYIDVEGPRPSQDSPGNKRDTQGEAERLYDAWKRLIPALILPFLAYLNKSAGHPTSNTFEQNHLSCTSCAPHTHKTTRVLCLFWDRN
jgi:hypothetical protein